MRGKCALVLIGLLAGCTGDPAMSVQPGAAGSPGADAASSFAQFTDLPLPNGNSIDMDRTLVLGGEGNWTGRLSITVNSRVGEMYDFFRREMPKFGWAELTSARSATSLLTFQRDNRIATVLIAPSRLIGSAVDITMAPKGQPAAEPVSPMQPVAPSPPRRGIDVQPAPRR
jgi:hypothetical protein